MSQQNIELRTQKAKDNYRALIQIIQKRQAYESSLPPKAQHSMPTTLDFTDAQGGSLLYYAILSNDINLVKELINKQVSVEEKVSTNNWIETKPIEIALQLELYPIVDLLIENGADIHAINQGKITNPQGRAYLQKKLNKDIENEFSTFNPYSISSKDIAKIVAANNLELYRDVTAPLDEFTLKSLIKYRKIDPLLKSYGLSNEEEKPDLLKIAIQTGNLDFVKSLLQDGCTDNLNAANYESSYLSLAAQLKHWDIVDFLESQGAEINYVSSYRHNLLFLLISQGDSKKLRHYLDENTINTQLINVDQYNLMHWAIVNNKPDCLEVLLEKAECKNMLKRKNIYGETPGMLAKRLNSVECLGCLKGHGINIQEIIPLKLELTSPNYFLKNIKQFFILTNRDLSYFSKNGYCNGLSFLFGLYTANGMKEYFEKTLALINKWDGSYEALTKSFNEQADKETWANNYDNLEELLTQWTNDITCFLAYLSKDPLFSDLKINQANRKAQYYLIKAGDHFIQVPLTVNKSYKHCQMTKEQLTEILELLQTQPAGLFIDICSKIHNVGSVLSKTQQFDYFDPNNVYSTPESDSAQSLATKILDTAFVKLRKELGYHFISDKLFNLELQWMNLAKNQQHYIDFNFYTQEQYPKCNEDTIKLTSNHNLLTPLHIAVITHSYHNIEDLLNNPFIDIHAKDAHGKTALDLAIDSQDSKIVDLFLQNNPNLLSKDKIMSLLSQQNPCLIIALKYCDESYYQEVLDYALIISPQHSEITNELINNDSFLQYNITADIIENLVYSDFIEISKLSLKGRVKSDTIKNALSCLLWNADIKPHHIKRFFSLDLGSTPKFNQIRWKNLKKNCSPEIEALLREHNVLPDTEKHEDSVIINKSAFFAKQDSSCQSSNSSNHVEVSTQHN